MSVKRTGRKSRTKDRTDWARVDRLSDADIERAVAGDPDAAPILSAEWFSGARVVMPEPKVPVSLRLDRDVLEWFRASGSRYQTRINAVLRAYVRAKSSGKKNG